MSCFVHWGWLSYLCGEVNSLHPTLDDIRTRVAGVIAQRWDQGLLMEAFNVYASVSEDIVDGEMLQSTLKVYSKCPWATNFIPLQQDTHRSTTKASFKTTITHYLSKTDENDKYNNTLFLANFSSFVIKSGAHFSTELYLSFWLHLNPCKQHFLFFFRYL